MDAGAGTRPKIAVLVTADAVHGDLVGAGDIIDVDCERERLNMGQLLVRELDQALIDASRKRAAARGHGAEAEHRAILEQVSRGPERRTLAEALLEIPDVGRDEDFARGGDDDDDHRVRDRY